MIYKAIPVFAFFTALAFASPSLAVVSKMNKAPLAYSVGTEPMEGYISFESDGTEMKRPAILIVSDWMGLSEFGKAKADEMAKLGFVALAVDMYGKGKNPKTTEEAAALAGKYKKDIPLLRSHIRAAYDKLAGQKNVDPTKIMVIGYCFGGTVALELARSGARLNGVATFHAGLANPNPKDAKNIEAPVLVMHGADDPYVPAAEVAAFKKEMKDAKTKLQFISYPGAVHSFTIPSAGSDNSKGAAYNAEADKKSWHDFMLFMRKL